MLRHQDCSDPFPWLVNRAKSFVLHMQLSAISAHFSNDAGGLIDLNVFDPPQCSAISNCLWCLWGSVNEASILRKLCPLTSLHQWLYFNSMEPENEISFPWINHKYLCWQESNGTILPSALPVLPHKCFPWLNSLTDCYKDVKMELYNLNSSFFRRQFICWTQSTAVSLPFCQRPTGISDRISNIS